MFFVAAFHQPDNRSRSLAFISFSGKQEDENFDCDCYIAAAADDDDDDPVMCAKRELMMRRERRSRRKTAFNLRGA